jgi:phosphate transport system substrate-binding protein
MPGRAGGAAPVTVGRVVLAALLLLAGGSGQAAMTRPQLLLDETLAELAPAPVAGNVWSVLGREALLGAFCAPREGALLRVALTTRPPSDWQHAACIAVAGAALTDQVVGHQVLLAFGGASPPPLTSALLFRALAARVPAASGGLVDNRAASWHALDPSLPDWPIRLLLPPDGTAEARILREVVLYRGCVATVRPALPRLAGECEALGADARGDAAVARAGPGGAASWLRTEGASAVALVGLGTVVAAPELENALPLDGVAPALASIADGTYPGAVPVHLLVLRAGVPADAVRALTAESAIGPMGTLARRGLAALPAAERVRLRAE